MSEMLSERSKRSLTQVFVRAASANLKGDVADAIEIEQLSGAQRIEPPEKSLVVLTLVSYAFRLVTIFHVDVEGPMSAHFLGARREAEFFEVFGEIANRCCGAMNRELGEHFPHMGMSTPILLERPCLAFLDALKPSYVVQYRIRLGMSAVLHASLCFCAYTPLDFQIDPPRVQESTGELELF